MDSRILISQVKMIGEQMLPGKCQAVSLYLPSLFFSLTHSQSHSSAHLPNHTLYVTFCSTLRPSVNNTGHVERMLVLLLFQKVAILNSEQNQRLTENLQFKEFFENLFLSYP